MLSFEFSIVSIISVGEEMGNTKDALRKQDLTCLNHYGNLAQSR